MPQIKQYTTTQSAQTSFRHMPTADTADFGGPGMQNLGASMIQAGSDIGRASRALAEHDVRDEVTKAYTLAAKAEADYTVELDQRAAKATPGDETFSDSFNTDVKGRLDSLADQFQTTIGQQEWAKQTARLGAHFVQQAGAFQAKLAGTKAIQDFTTLVDSNQVVLNNDPMRFEQVLQATTAALNDPRGTYARILAIQRDEIVRKTREQLAVSAMEGVIRAAPELGQQMLREGTGPVQFITGEAKNVLERTAQVGIHARETMGERQRLAQEHARKVAEEAVVSTWLGKIIDPKTNGALSDAEILGDKVTTPQQKEWAIEYRLRRARELAAEAEPKTNPAEVRALMLQIHAPDDDPMKTYNMDPIMDAYRAGRISTNEMTFLRKEVEQLRDGDTSGFQKDVQNARNAVYTALTRSVMGQVQPEVAADAAYRWSMDFEAAIARKRKANEDPRALLTPGNKEYALSPERIKSYMVSGSEALQRGADKAKVLENEKRTEQFIEEGKTLSAEETKAKYIPGYVPKSEPSKAGQPSNVPKPEPPKAEPPKPQSNVPKTALDAFASLKGESKTKALNLYQELKKAHVTNPGPASTALVEHLHQAYVNMGIGAAQARLFANESVAEIKKTLDAKR